MEAKNKNNAEQLPLELELDLLVDEELPESRRRELLRSMDKDPAQWRDLSIRFLERQVEKKSARQLMAPGGGAMVPAKTQKTTDAPVRNFKFPGAAWLTPGRMVGIAAGLLVAVSSALVTVVVMRQAQTHQPDNSVAVNVPQDGMISTYLPGSVMGDGNGPVKVQVSLSNKSLGNRLFPEGAEGGPGSRSSVVIKPDGVDNALVIPVKNLQFQ